MAEFDNLSNQIELLKTWSGEIPVRVATELRRVDATRDTDLSTLSGERHGSWFLEVAWRQGELSKTASIALTNPLATADASSAAAVVTARAAASSATRFVTEVVFEARRSAARVTAEQMEDWLLAAIVRAIGYSEPSLIEAYALGVGSGNS